MTTSQKNIILGAIDETLEEHFKRKRAEVSTFVDRHFSLSEAMQIQKQSVAFDLLYYPLNAAWSIPFLTLKKVTETLDKMGWSSGNSILKRIPSGIKTRYQKMTEKILLDEFLGSSQEEIFKSLEEKLKLQGQCSDFEIQEIKRKMSELYREEVDKFSSAQALVTDLIITIVTLAVGKLFFHDGALGMAGMGAKIAKKMANDDAAQRFFLGKKLGSTFYHIFPVAPTRTEIYVATFGIGLLLTVFSIAAAVFSDPVRKTMGIQASKLTALVDSLEQNLYLVLKNELKGKMKQNNETLVA